MNIRKALRKVWRVLLKSFKHSNTSLTVIISAVLLLELMMELRLAVEEAVVNVIDYAYPIGTEDDITIRVLSDGKTVRIQIVDKGQAFDPTAMQRADTTLSAEERNIGGLGILLVREQMDSINYERTDGKNVLTLIKKIK